MHVHVLDYDSLLHHTTSHPSHHIYLDFLFVLFLLSRYRQSINYITCLPPQSKRRGRGSTGPLARPKKKWSMSMSMRYEYVKPKLLNVAATPGIIFLGGGNTFSTKFSVVLTD